MMERIAIVAATEMEIRPLLAFLEEKGSKLSVNSYKLKDTIIDIAITGIGILPTTYSLMEYLNNDKPDGWIQLGIGGTLDKDLPIGEVYQIKSEMLFGEGAQEKDGQNLSPFTLGWLDKNQAPYTDGVLNCPYGSSLQKATGMTSLMSHGEEEFIRRIKSQAHGQIENMEGAPFFYISLLKNIPFLSFRSISNLVEARDTTKWNIPLAVQQLNNFAIEILQTGNAKDLFRIAPDSM